MASSGEATNIDEARAHERSRRVARRYGPFQCDECAAEIIRALGRGSGARVVRIRPGDDSLNIGLHATNRAISENRTHVGVRVGDVIFDNLHHDGVPAVGWLDQFFTTGAPLVLEERPVGDFFGRIFLRRRFNDWVNES